VITVSGPDTPGARLNQTGEPAKDKRLGLSKPQQTNCRQLDTNGEDMTRIEVKRSSQKIERSGAFGDYEVSGWRYVDDVTWQVKVWLAGSPRDWFGYTMTSEQRCEPNILSEAQRSALSQVIANWEV
jgi:hypothetical protein